MDLYRRSFFIFGLLAGLLFFGSQELKGASTSAVFGGGPFYSGGISVMNDLRASGFTTVILWTIHVDSTSGDLILNDQKVVSNGVYVGNSAWPNQLATLKQAPTSVRRIEVGIGSWGVNDFQSIKTLMAAQGTNNTSILYRNFSALKKATGADAINLDDEMLYDVASTVKFCLMAASLGYKVSLCPYNNPSFWSGCMTQINNQTPGTVDAIFLQCYAGGAGNNPSTWNNTFGGFKVFPGLWCRHGGNCSEGDSPASVASQMAAWKSSAGINGGFMWLYDDMRSCTSEGTTADYARAINSVFRLPAPTGLTGIPGGSTVMLSWNPSAGATGYNIKRALYPPGPYSILATNVQASWFLDSGLALGTRWYYEVGALDANGEGAFSAPVGVLPCNGILPEGWFEEDIGNNGLPGSSTYCGKSFTIQAGGSDIGGQADSFHFAYTSTAGNGAVIARVSLLEGGEPGARAGVMFRVDATRGSAFVDIVVVPGQGILMQSRSAADGVSDTIAVGGITAPVWLQLVREGDMFTGYYAKDGVNWTFVGAVPVSMAENVISGLATTAHSATHTVLAIIDNVSTGAPVVLQPTSPISVTRFEGASCTLSATASAALPVYYNWTQDGAILTDAHGTTLSLANLISSNTGQYSIVVSNAFGCITSSVASLTVVASSNTLYPRTVVGDHPIGFWRLNESSGKVAFDCVNGNDGAYSNVWCGQPGYTAYDKSARFGSLARSNSYVTIAPVDFATSGNAAFSVEAWVNGIAQTNDSGLLTKGTGAGGEQFNLDCGSGSHAFRFFVRDAAGGVHLANTSVTPNGKWHHLVGVCDEAHGKVTLYVDGSSAGQGTITAGSGLLATSNPMTVGARQSGAGTPFDLQFVGTIADVAVYNFALSAAQVQAHYTVTTNRPPVFVANPFIAMDATAGQAYSRSIGASASDPNGGVLSFSKVSGADWLTVSADGSLTGTPFSGDAGGNVFEVVVKDSVGLSAIAVMNLNVVAAPAIKALVSPEGTNLLLSWTGGIAPYQVEMATDLTSPVWQAISAPLTGSNMMLVPSNSAAFYRVGGK